MENARKQNVAAALFVGGLAMISLLGSTDLDMGTAQEIGPGFFPIILATILLALCALLFVRSLRSSSAQEQFTFDARVRSLLGVIGALAVFALTMRGAAFGPVQLPALGVTGAAPLAIVTAGLASDETRWPQLIVLAVVLTVGCTALFRFMLGLPLPVAPWLLGY